MKKLLLVCLVALMILTGCSTAKAADAGIISSATTPAVVTGSDLPATKLLVSEVPLKLVSVTHPVWPGDEVKVVIQTAPNMVCMCNLSSGHSFKADENGIALLTFTIDKNQTPGYLRLQIEAGKIASRYNAAYLGTPPPNAPKTTFIAEPKATIITSILVN